MKRKVLIVVAGGLLLATTAFTFRISSDRADSSNSLLALQTRYSLTLITEANLNLGIGPGRISEKLNTELLSTVLSASSQGREIFFQLTHPTLTVEVDGIENAPQAQAIQIGLTQGFLARFGAQGELQTISAPASFDGMTEAMAHAIPALMQVAHLPEFLENTIQWLSTEIDGTGTYQSQYRYLKNDSDNLLLSKQILRYALTNSDPNRTLLPVPSGNLELSLFKNTRGVRSVRGEQRIALNYLSGGSAGSEKTFVQLTWLNEMKLPEASMAALLRQIQFATRSAPRKPDQSAHLEEQNKEIQRRELNGMTMADLKSALHLMNAAKAVDEKAQRDLFLKLRAMMLLNPEKSIEIGKMVSELEKGGAAFNVVIGVLAATQTPEAQEGLREVVDAVRDDARLVASIIPNLSMVSSPTTETENFLRKLEKSSDEDIRDSAKLGLGMVASHLSLQGEEDRARAIVRTALTDLKSASDLGNQVLALKAIGNSGSSEAFSAIQGYLDDTSPELRRQAVNALRFIPGEAADEALVSTLIKDRDEDVRAQAALSLGFRQPTLFLLLSEKKQYSVDPSLQVRRQLLRAIHSARTQFSEDAGDFLTKVARVKDKDLSPLAEDLLAQ